MIKCTQYPVAVYILNTSSFYVHLSYLIRFDRCRVKTGIPYGVLNNIPLRHNDSAGVLVYVPHINNSTLSYKLAEYCIYFVQSNTILNSYECGLYVVDDIYRRIRYRFYSDIVSVIDGTCRYGQSHIKITM